MLKDFAPGSNRPAKARYRYDAPADSFPNGRNWLWCGETFPGSEVIVYRHRLSGQTRFHYLDT